MGLAGEQGAFAKPSDPWMLTSGGKEWSEFFQRIPAVSAATAGGWQAHACPLAIDSHLTDQRNEARTGRKSPVMHSPLVVMKLYVGVWMELPVAHGGYGILAGNSDSLCALAPSPPPTRKVRGVWLRVHLPLFRLQPNRREGGQGRREKTKGCFWGLWPGPGLPTWSPLAAETTAVTEKPTDYSRSH